MSTNSACPKTTEFPDYDQHKKPPSRSQKLPTSTLPVQAFPNPNILFYPNPTLKAFKVTHLVENEYSNHSPNTQPVFHVHTTAGRLFPLFQFYSNTNDWISTDLSFKLLDFIEPRLAHTNEDHFLIIDQPNCFVNSTTGLKSAPNATKQ